MLIPLEKLQLSGALNGARGSNRANANTVKQISADDDRQAIEAWLAEFRDSPQTHRHYRKEAERLLLWAIVQRGKPLSSLTREDCVAYEEFLLDPQPSAIWCGRKAPRFSGAWKPFTGPLSTASQRTALLVINSLFNYLVAAGYLAGNPLALIKRRGRKSAPARETVERFLEDDQWQALRQSVERLPQDSPRQRRHYERARFLLSLLYLLGPRVNEIASHAMNSFVEIRGRWWWQVVGKGGKSARVPVNQEMLAALQRYRRFYDLPAMPAPDDETPLVMSLNGTSAITDNMIYRIVKDLVARAADALAATDAYKADKLRSASTHWLRHTSITHQADAGISLTHLQRNARHSKLETTALYLHTEDDAWHQAMERHGSKKPDKPGE